MTAANARAFAHELANTGDWLAHMHSADVPALIFEAEYDGIASFLAQHYGVFCADVMGDYEKALSYSLHSYKLFPTALTLGNICHYAIHCDEQFYAVDFIRAEYPPYADSVHLNKHFCQGLAGFGFDDEARQYGQKALDILAEQVAAKPVCQPLRPKPAFTTDRAKNIIAFSLFGTAPRYTEMAFINVRECARIYPAWTPRFYVGHDVPVSVLQELEQRGCQLVPMPASPLSCMGYFWRFYAMNDPAIDFCLVRDVDSVVHGREAVAVSAWLQSNRLFHVMRDDFYHCELILAGLWGGVAGVLPDLPQLAEEYLRQKPGRIAKGVDQAFLAERVWPNIRQSVLAHDRCFSFAESVPFPANAPEHPNGSLGQNDFILPPFFKPVGKK